MDHHQDFLNAVGFFRQAFVVVFALALTEALKQFVADQPKQTNDPLSDKLVHWDRLPALLAFVFLIVPFFHGTVRYFYLTYESQKTASVDYDRYLVVDGVAFLIEATLFFAMSRAITPTRWRSLYMSIVCLLGVDSVWSLIEYRHGALPTPDWIYLNIGLGLVLVLLMRFIGKHERWGMWALCLGAAAVIIRTSGLSLRMDILFPRGVGRVSAAFPPRLQSQTSRPCPSICSFGASSSK